MGQKGKLLISEFVLCVCCWVKIQMVSYPEKKILVSDIQKQLKIEGDLQVLHLPTNSKSRGGK